LAVDGVTAGLEEAADAAVTGAATGVAAVEDAAGVEAQCSFWRSMSLDIIASRDFSMALSVPDAAVDELGAGLLDDAALSRLA